jgi:hypothetical protein
MFMQLFELKQKHAITKIIYGSYEPNMEGE